MIFNQFYIFIDTNLKITEGQLFQKEAAYWNFWYKKAHFRSGIWKAMFYQPYAVTHFIHNLRRNACSQTLRTQIQYQIFYILGCKYYYSLSSMHSFAAESLVTQLNVIVFYHFKHYALASLNLSNILQIIILILAIVLKSAWKSFLKKF